MNIETMRLLVAKGLSADDILEIAETMNAPTKRSAAAERQARYRARQKEAENVTDGVTGDVTGDCNDPSLSPFPPQTPPNPHTHPDITTRVREAFPMPEWCPSVQVWSDLKANRKAKRLPCTATAHAKLIRDIEKMADDDWPPGRLLEAIVARGWAAAYDPRDERKPANDRQRSQLPRPTTRELGERVAARFASGGGGAADSLPRLGAPGGHDR